MKVLLINPPGTEQAGFTNPPLNLLYLAGTLIAGGIDVRVVDACVGGLIGPTLLEYKPDIVGISCLTPARHSAFEAASLAKAVLPDCKVILGGAHATIMYRQILQNYPQIDAIILGEGEQALLEICRQNSFSSVPGVAYRTGEVTGEVTSEVVRTARREYVQDIDTIPFPAWGLIDTKKYPSPTRGHFNGVDLREPRISVIFSRGCIGRCTFCSTWWIWRGYRHRSPKNMADELELLYNQGVRHFCFADDALTVDQTAVMELCDEIIRRKMRIAFHATTRTDRVNFNLLEKLREAGCYEIAYGIETGDEDLLLGMNKENTTIANLAAIVLTQRVGIKATALMIVGNPGETEQSIQKTIHFLREARPDNVGCIGGLWVLPGTQVYRDCVKKGFINDEYWLGREPLKIYTLEQPIIKIREWQNRVTNYSTTIRIKSLCSAAMNRIAVTIDGIMKW